MFTISVDKQQLKTLMSSINKMEKHIERAALNLPKELAQQFSVEMIAAIVDQKYAEDYAPLSKKYAERKAKEGKSPKFWIYNTDLLSSITYWRSGAKGWGAGIPRSAKNESGKSIRYYGSLNERGKGKLPSRPLITPTLNDFLGRHGMKSFTDTKLKEVQKGMRAIWRNR